MGNLGVRTVYANYSRMNRTRTCAYCIMKTRHRVHAHFSSNSVAPNQYEPIIASNIYLVHIKDSPAFHSRLQAVANGSLLHVQQSQHCNNKLKHSPMCVCITDFGSTSVPNNELLSTVKVSYFTFN